MSDRRSSRGAARAVVVTLALISAGVAGACGTTEPQPEPVPTSVALEYQGKVAPGDLIVRRGDVLEFEIVVRDSAGTRLHSRRIELLDSWETQLGPRPVDITVHGDSVTVRTTTAGWAAFIPRVDGWLYGPNFLGMLVQPINPTPRLTGSYTFSGVDAANDMNVTGTLAILDTATTVSQSRISNKPGTYPPDGARLLTASGTIQRCTRSTGACTAVAPLQPSGGPALSIADGGMFVDTLGVMRLNFYFPAPNPGPCPPQTASNGSFSVHAASSGATTIGGDYTYRETYCTGGQLSGSGTVTAVR